MKKALSMVLALLMLMTLCITPVMAEEPEGSASNPYYVANPMNAPQFITIPANGAVYYQYKAAVFNGWSVSGYGLTSIIVDGVEYAEANMWGEIKADFNFNFMSPGIVAYVNDTEEEVQVMLTHGQPVGTLENPAELSAGENALSIPPSIMDYVSVFVPMVNGDFTFSVNQPEDFMVTVFTNGSPAEGGTANPVENGSLTLTLESYMPVYVVTTPVGMTGDVVLTVTEPKAGTEANPIWLEADVAYDLVGTDPLYFQVDGAWAGNQLLVESQNGTPLTLDLDGVVFTAENGSLYLNLDTTEWVMSLVVSQESADANKLYFSVKYAEGTMENPAAIELGDTNVSRPEGAATYYYSYVAEKDGLLVVTPSAVENIGYLAMNNADYSNYTYLSEGAAFMQMPVAAGEAITIEITAADDEETWVTKPLDIVLNLAQKDLVLYTTFEEGELGGWDSSSVLTADDVEYASGWYSAKFEAVADWANIFNYINLEANTDYVITFKAKAALAKGAWIKFNDNWAADFAQAEVALTTEWADYEVTLNSGDKTSAVLLLQYAGYGADGQIIWIDDFCITKGATETPEQPAGPEVPEDAIYYDGFDADLGTWGTNAGATIEIVPSTDAPVVNPQGGNGVLKHVIPGGAYPFISDRTPITVEPNTDYIISIDALNTSANWPLEVKVGTDYWFGGSVFASDSFTPSTTEWGTYTFKFNSGDNTQVYFGMKSKWASSTIYFDNYMVVKAPETPVEPDPELPVEGNLFVNGTFEDGNADGWATYQGSAVSADAAKNGAYGFNAIGNGGWGGMINQTVAVEAGKTYKLSFWIKVVSNGVNIQVKDANETKFEGSPAGWYDGNKYAEWTYVEKSFVAHADSLNFNVCGAGNGKAESAYLDSITLVQLPDPSFDGYITNGDFEMGDLAGWINLWDACGVDFVEGKDGGLALDFTAGNWAQVRQDGIKVEANTDYVITAWVKDANNVGLIVKAGDDSGDIKSVGPATFDGWQQVTVEFNSGDQTSVCLLIIGWEGGGSAIVDDIVMAKVEKPVVEAGDANGDGKVNNRDLGLLQQYLNDFDVEPNLEACDVNGDGKVNNRDLGMLQQLLNA